MSDDGLEREPLRLSQVQQNVSNPQTSRYDGTVAILCTFYLYYYTRYSPCDHRGEKGVFQKLVTSELKTGDVIIDLAKAEGSSIVDEPGEG